MKPWIKRAGIGIFGAIALFGGLAAWAHSHERGHSWRGMSNLSDAESQAREDKFVDRAAGKLNLDAAQKAKLSAVALALREQRKALIPAGSAPRADMQSLVAGPTFDRAKAAAMVEAKLGAVSLKSPAVLAAAADFYDSLKPEQQAQVRDFMSRRRGHHG